MAEFWSALHFLRPLWLLALLGVPLLYWRLRRYWQQGSGWETAIEAPLLEHLLEQQVTRRSQAPLWLLCAGIYLAILALAGPIWKKLPQPVHQVEDALVLVLDQSLSMLATDLSPSRQVKVRHKLIDLLEQRREGLTALVVYAGDAHRVAPLTDDQNTIAALVPALSPLIMPALGSNPEPGIELALQLLQDSGISAGHILLVTDGIESHDSGRIAEHIQNSGHRLSILVVGTAEGGPIPIPEQGFLKDGDQIVIARVELEPLRDLARRVGGRLTSLQLDDSDIHYLLADTGLAGLSQNTREVEREFDQWREEGPWLILLLVPLAALAFRRGWLFTVLFVLILQPPPVYAFGWQDLWRTPDQQGRRALEQGNPERAAELFETPLWKGSAAYQAGEYERASEAFAGADNAAAHYNRGNALAKAGQLQQALAAYDEALTRNPDHADARFNQELVRRLLDQQEQQQQEQQQGDQNQPQQDDQDGNQAQDASAPQDGEQGMQPPEQQNADQTPAENTPTESEGTQPQEPEQQAGEEPQEQDQGAAQQAEAGDQAEPAQPEAAAAQEFNSELSDEEQQALEQWLRRIPDDPSGLLRRKFDYEYRQRQLEHQFLPRREGDKPW